MGRYARKKQHKGNKVLRLFKTKRKTKDIDEIHEDLKPEGMKRIAEQVADPDLPGEGKHYCITCAEHFIDSTTLLTHMKSKRHKRRRKKFDVEAYTQEEADRAGGLGSYIAPKRTKLDVAPADVMDHGDET